MRIIGIDPGLQCTGYGVIEVNGRSSSLLDGGVVRTDAAAPLELRLLTIYEGIIEVLEEFRPESAAVEQLYAKYSHPGTAVLMGHTRGVIYLAAAAQQIPVTAYEASLVKKAITGSGRASKEQVGRMVARLLSLSEAPEPVDVTDALALAICHGRPVSSHGGRLHPDIAAHERRASAAMGSRQKRGSRQ
jgi:crossover junction endodeoxyribonuclease RuvC